MTSTPRSKFGGIDAIRDRDRPKKSKIIGGISVCKQIRKSGACPLAPQIGSAISQANPAGCQLNPISPLAWWIKFAITLVPKPLRVGGVTAGPPVSVQRTMNCPISGRVQETPIRPLHTDKAPYLTALVVSSCKTTAIVCAVLGSSLSAGPSIATRVPSPLAVGGEFFGDKIMQFGTGPARLNE